MSLPKKDSQDLRAKFLMKNLRKTPYPVECQLAKNLALRANSSIRTNSYLKGSL
jgi:hypothetical protein